MDYDFKNIEQKWLKKWEKTDLYRAKDFDKKPKKYILVEFPYPSGERLHVGHGRSYVALDVMSRKSRMDGFNILYPMGWDAFGLPAENYAIKTGINPQITTEKNIANAKIQAKNWGLSFDWEREVNTTDPKYYRWTQWIFLKLFEKELAYQDEVAVNWCSVCQTNLADEEVMADGKHERCGSQTERRMQKQWLLKITAYADKLLEDLKEVDFPSAVRSQQENWIGRTEGIVIDYPISGSDKIISCYSTRPDTNFGASFVAIAPEHPLIKDLIKPEKEKEVKEYIENSRRKSEMERVNLSKEKTGVFTGSYCLNRLTNKEMPIWVSDFVVLTAGTGAVVGVPAHDERDFDFAQKHNLEILPVIKPKTGDWNYDKSAFVDIDEAIVFNSDFLNDLPVKEAIIKVIDYLTEKGWGKKSVNYHLRDWVFSRQHYWGEPIPIIHCEKCGAVAVGEKDLPVELPFVEKYQPSGTGESPLAKIEDWVNVKCPKCKGLAKRETDTMPNWAGSNWYFMRYCDPQNKKELADKKKLSYWLPVDLYNGGMEHVNLHLLHSRFIYKFLYDIGVAPTKEPYLCRTFHGMILGSDNQKMSKSRGNVVNPDDILNNFGADAFRLYECFIGPFDQMIAWNPNGVEGCLRFIKKVWHLAEEKIVDKTSDDLEKLLHKTIKKVGEDIEAMKFNTAIASMMEFINAWQEKSGLSKDDFKKFILILAPFAPFLAEELWDKIGGKFSVHQNSWPEYDTKILSNEKSLIVIQINGKIRSQLEINKGASEEEVKNLALADEKIKNWLVGKEIHKVIFVADKIINFVI